MSMSEKEPRGGKKLLWFAAIWLASVAALAAFAYGVRALLGL
ncbi:DUF2474 family protein [Parvibaculum sp.]|jgi:hypothetical protein|nr:DUF2474 family protein [Parvibaculum sp.]